MSEPTTHCPCGRPLLHYSDPILKMLVSAIVAKKGPEIKVVVEGRVFFVSRHYIALHGITAQDLVKQTFPFIREAPVLVDGGA